MNSDNTLTRLDAERMLSHAYWHADDGDAKQTIYDLRNQIRKDINKRFLAVHRMALVLNPSAPWL